PPRRGPRGSPRLDPAGSGQPRRGRDRRRGVRAGGAKPRLDHRSCPGRRGETGRTALRAAVTRRGSPQMREFALRVLSYLPPRRRTLLWALLQVLLISACEMLKPWPLKIIIDSVLSGQPP